MNARLFSDAMGELDVRYVDEALSYKKRSRKPGLVKWLAAAACLCVAAGLSIAAMLLPQRQQPELLTAEGHLEIIDVELKGWQSNGFLAVVVDTGNSSAFPAGAELTVVFREYSTEIVLGGAGYSYGEIQTGDIGWESGDVIEVSFGVYERYDPGRGYDNKVYAYRAEAVTP